jgi:hypothetical protein
MNVNGLWTAEFYAGANSGTGVVVLLDGQMFGGDANYYYKGQYAENSGSLKGALTVTHYAGPLTNVFGPARALNLVIEAQAGENLIVGQASVGLQRMSFKLKRVHQLPRAR